MQAIVLAAGEGRRLRPLTKHRPKVMLPVGGRPILEHVVEALTANGVTEITFVVGYHREVIQTHFQDGDDWGAKITYVNQDRQLGTGHALATGFDAVRPERDFLVLPGDNHVSAQLVKALIDAPGDAALVTTQSPEPAKYGVVETEGESVVRIEEKPTAPRSRLISTGIYRFSPAIRGHIENSESVVLTDAVNRAIDGGMRVTSVATEDAWDDVVYPWDILTVNHRVLRALDGVQNAGTTEENVAIRGAARIGTGTQLRNGCYIIGPVQIGEHCDIGPHVVIRGPTTIGNHVRIGPFSDIENVSVMDNAQIDSGALLRHTIVDEGARIGPRVSTDRGPTVFETEDGFMRIDSLGAVIGQDAFLGANVVLEPGAIIGNGATIAPNRVAHRLPDKGMVN